MSSFTASMHGVTEAHNRLHPDCVTFQAKGVMQRVDVSCPKHVAAATAKVFNRAMQAKVVSRPFRSDVFAYRGFEFFPSGLSDLWEVREDANNADTAFEADDLFDAMDRIDAVLAERTNSQLDTMLTVKAPEPVGGM